MPKVAVVGSGVAGLTCASELVKRGFDVSVFEQGRGVGGRMSTRRVTLEDKTELQFDHGVSYFTCSSPHFQDILAEWVEAGVVAPWEGRIGIMDIKGQKDRDGAVMIVDKEAPVGRKRYVGHPKMSSIGSHIISSSGVKVHAGTRVTGAQLSMDDKSAHGGGATWSLTTRSSNKPTQPHVVEGPFSAVVVADRQFASNSNVFMYGEVAPIETILDVKSMANVLQTVGNVSVFVLIVAFEHPVDIPHDGMLVENHNVVSSFYRDSSKPGRPAASGDQWVMHAGVNASKEYINMVSTSCAVGSEEYEKYLIGVADKMYDAFQEVLLEILPGTPLPPLLYKQAHRWKSAFPSQAVAPVDGCLIDDSKHLVACGDFCFEPSERPFGFVEAATLSGRAAAIKVAEICTRAQALEPKL
eukprot:CAMPEP_0198228740 /NCGR_PEP_ID=MMETSP1445-20131203/113756_1 /TAXON_ID=36898 /ORGANISM="Pyramimonas sp., Strain CCMP2087" /LENGTH=411 /DNA_ID=CAMNT_0043909159 /DNA_START=303 /DNA_END=1538 /DNA_ORIENTATION=+